LKCVKTFGNGQDILRIVDLTDFVKEQARILHSLGEDKLLTPVEVPYPVDKEIADILGM
jgi:hypothetical protein